jgi:large subunit ribosomal protein L29
MKAKDLRERPTDDLVELRNTMRKDLFSYRMKNFTNQLEDTSLLGKTKRDIARLEQILHERALKPAQSDGAES